MFGGNFKENMVPHNQSKRRCDGSLVAHQNFGAEVLGSNLASPTMILMRCRSIVKNVENLRAERETYPSGKKKI